jgi:GGDEF domain-containing protein
LPAWVGKIRAQLRAGDFAGILSEREIAVLLCGASAEHANSVSARLKRVFRSDEDADVFLQATIGMTTRSPESSAGGSIVGAARALASSRH